MMILLTRKFLKKLIKKKSNINKYRFKKKIKKSKKPLNMIIKLQIQNLQKFMITKIIYM